MRALQALELAIRRQVNDPRTSHEFAEGLRDLAFKLQIAADEADEADGDKQASYLAELDDFRRMQS